MARAALSRHAIDGPSALTQRQSEATPVCYLAAKRATYGPYRPRRRVTMARLKR